MMELPGSLHKLRAEHEALREIRRVQRERREDMPQAQVTMNVRRMNERASVIDVQGELTAFAENVLMDAYAQASAGGTKNIVLNFGGLEYMNSSGIGLLVTLLIRANRQGEKILTYGLSEHYRHIFELTRLDEAIGIYDGEEEALEAASR
jgi:anti-sigma B factor antagonist